MVTWSRVLPSRPLVLGRFRLIEQHVEFKLRVFTHRSPCNLVASEVKWCITASTLESMFV